MAISRIHQMIVFNLLPFAFISVILAIANAERVSDKIYSTLQSNHYCGRRLNATHQMGCSSDLGGNFGTLWIVESQDDIDHVLRTGPTAPYVAVLERNFFTRENLLTFRDQPSRISGVVFINEDSKSRVTPFSPEDTCPNRNSGLYVNHTQYRNCNRGAWIRESSISGLLYDDIPYPIFLINEEQSIKEIRHNFKTHNVITQPQQDDPNRPTKKIQAPYPLCGLQLDSFMMAAQDSNLCSNSHFFIDELLQSDGRRCKLLDNPNIFAYYKTASGPLQPKPGTNHMQPKVVPPRSIVMLIAKLSSLSMFNDISPGADSTLTSIITLLTVAEALGRMKNSTAVEESKRNIAFALLNSEPFDYTGSSRMVYEMLDGSFPYGAIFEASNKTTDAMMNMNLTSIDYIINLDQMAIYPGADSIHFHSEPEDTNKDKLDRVFKKMESVASSEKLKFQRVDAQKPLPPAPVGEFIKRSREQRYSSDKELTGIVISNYGEAYHNLFYHSIYDDSHNIDQTSRAKLIEHLATVSKFIARSLYEFTFEVEKSDEITVDKNLIEQLLQCYLENAECHLFTRATNAGQKLPSGPVQTYKDPTKQSDDICGIITKNLLTYFLGDKMTDFNRAKCSEENQRTFIYNYDYINDKNEPVSDGSSGLCVRSQVMMVSAQSPAFSLSLEGGFHIDQKYPAWTVSFNSIRNPVRLYLKPSPVSQWATIILGIVITIASFIIVYELRENLAKIDSQVDVAQIATST